MAEARKISAFALILKNHELAGSRLLQSPCHGKIKVLCKGIKAVFKGFIKVKNFDRRAGNDGNGTVLIFDILKQSVNVIGCQCSLIVGQQLCNLFRREQKDHFHIGRDLTAFDELEAEWFDRRPSRIGLFGKFIPFFFGKEIFVEFTADGIGIGCFITASDKTARQMLL